VNHLIGFDPKDHIIPANLMKKIWRFYT